MKPFGRATAGGFIVAILMATVTGCAGEAALQRLQEARRLTAELLVQFTKAADATNRVVMADTDEASGAFTREAEQATQAVQRNSEALKPLLVGLGYSKESQLLEEFDGRFAEYRTLDRSILELALENTNVKAQRLSFGPASGGSKRLPRFCGSTGSLGAGKQLADPGARRNGRIGSSGNPSATGGAYSGGRRYGDDADREANGDR